MNSNHRQPPYNLRLCLALFLALLAFYLLTYTPRINSSDGLAMFATAESLARRGALDVEQIRWMDLQQGTYGLDGLLYSRKGVGVPVGLLPLVALGLAAPGLGPVSAGLLFNAIVTALTGVLLLIYVQALGFAPKTGLHTALAFGLATLAWPYAKSLFSDPFCGLLLLAAALALLKFRQTRQLRWLLLAGLLLGWNVATRYAEAVFLPVFGLLLLYYLFTIYNLRFAISATLAFAAPLALVGLALAAFNLSRYGNALNTGYLPTETFSAVWLDGLGGQLVSPGRGLFLFSPIFIVSVMGLPPLWRRRRAEALLGLSIILIHLLLYGKWFMWHGGFAWGPRFLVPTLPFWALFLAPALELAAAPGARLAARLALAALAGLSALVQLPFLLVDFSPYQGWLLDTGLPLFARETFFAARYSPFGAVWQFITPTTLDVAWAWQGQINWLLLAALAINLAACGAALRQISQPEKSGASRLLLAALLTTFMAGALLLAHAHTLLPPLPLQTAVAALNRDVTGADAVITNTPDNTAPFAERYAGRAPVLGLNSGGFPLPADTTRRLNETMAAHAQIWWLPNWLPPAQSAVEQTLLANMVRVRNEDFAGQRLALFAAPPTGPQIPTAALFGNAIRLIGVTLPRHATGGAALTVELAWQAAAPVTEDYRVFVHLLDAAGQRLAQADGQPAQWTRPTFTWAAGETVTDRHGLWLNRNTPPGAGYRLQVGLYRPTDGQRLRLADGSDVVELAVTIY